MNRSTVEPRVPGRLLLKLARLMFDEPALSSVVCPALADMQQELRDSGANHARRALARWRGYWAFWKLVVVAPFAFPEPLLSGRVNTLLLGRNAGGALAVLVVAFSASMWSVFGWFVMGAVIGGLFLAIVMRWWYNGHPTTHAQADPQASRAAEINLSSIPVQGNAAGLIFAAGSVAIVFIGFPGLRLVFLAPLIAGAALAFALFVWRTAHPAGALPRNSIAHR